MNIWDNPANYTRCRKKLYEIHACMPPVGTVVVNILEQADVVRMLNGRTYFTAEEVINLKNQNHPLFATLQQLASQGKIYTVNETKNVVLAGTMGEMWVVDFNKLTSGYTNTNGTPIKNTQLRNWHRVKTVPNNSYAYACFVPANIQGQIQTAWGSVLNINGIGVDHGLGDFVIAGNGVGGNPDFSDRYVVNGVIFGRTYNNNGFTKNLRPEKADWVGISEKDLPKICISAKTKSTKENRAKQHLDKTCSLMQSLGADEDDIYAFRQIITSKDYQQKMHASFEMLCSRYHKFLRAFAEAKYKNPTLKCNFCRVHDSYRQADDFDGFDLGLDYEIKYKGVSYFGYFSFDTKYANFATWLSDRANDDPIEDIIAYDAFNLGWFGKHLEDVK